MKRLITLMLMLILCITGSLFSTGDNIGGADLEAGHYTFNGSFVSIYYRDYYNGDGIRMTIMTSVSHRNSGSIASCKVKFSPTRSTKTTRAGSTATAYCYGGASHTHSASSN